MPRLYVAAEDRFALVNLSGPPDDLLPELDDMISVAAAAQQLKRHWQVLWDLRELGTTVYRDTVEALRGVWRAAQPPDPGDTGPALTVLVPPGRAEEVRSALRPLPVTSIEMLPKQVPHQDVELDAFGDSDTFAFHPLIARAAQAGSVSPDVIVRACAGEDVEWSPVARDLAEQAWLDEMAKENYFSATEAAQRVIALDRALRAATTHSVLTQLALHADGGHVHITPYHGGGLHEALGADDHAVLLRPARVNRRYWATFDAAIAKLEALLNKRGVKEREIEAVLEDNPLFLNSLGFERIYHQVVLPGNGDSALKPDVIAEPAGSGWPRFSTSSCRRRTSWLAPRIGRRCPRHSRRLRRSCGSTLPSSKIVLAARAVEQKLGIKCYRPKLTEVVASGLPLSRSSYVTTRRSGCA